MNTIAIKKVHIFTSW